MVLSKIVDASEVARELLAPKERKWELVTMTAMTVNENWNGLHKQCDTLQEKDARMLYMRLRKMEKYVISIKRQRKQKTSKYRTHISRQRKAKLWPGLA